jgi:hypothetical protein
MICCTLWRPHKAEKFTPELDDEKSAARVNQRTDDRGWAVLDLGAMDSGILDVKLVPAWNAKEIQLFLKHSLNSFDFLQAGVAYWTINHKIFGDRLTRILSHKDSFVCVDLHAPSDIDGLAALARERQRRVHFYFEDIATVSDWGKREPPCLVHAKILLFWKHDRSAQLWVGSHNWTNRALYGLNVEASLVVMLRDSSRLFLDVFDYLGKIRGICDEFDPSKVDFYKQLQQKAQRADFVIELEGRDAANVGNERIWLFGSEVEDLKEVGRDWTSGIRICFRYRHRQRVPLSSYNRAVGPFVDRYFLRTSPACLQAEVQTANIGV